MDSAQSAVRVNSVQWAVTVGSGQSQCTLGSAQWAVGRRLWTEGCGGKLWFVALGIARDYDNDEQTNKLSFLSKESRVRNEGSAQVPHCQSLIFYTSLIHSFLYELEKVMRAQKNCFYCTHISP